MSKREKEDGIEMLVKVVVILLQYARLSSNDMPALQENADTLCAKIEGHHVMLRVLPAEAPAASAHKEILRNSLQMSQAAYCLPLVEHGIVDKAGALRAHEVLATRFPG